MSTQLLRGFSVQGSQAFPQRLLPQEHVGRLGTRSNNLAMEIQTPAAKTPKPQQKTPCSQNAAKLQHPPPQQTKDSKLLKPYTPQPSNPKPYSPKHSNPKQTLNTNPKPQKTLQPQNPTLPNPTPQTLNPKKTSTRRPYRKRERTPRGGPRSCQAPRGWAAAAGQGAQSLGVSGLRPFKGLGFGV